MAYTYNQMVLVLGLTGNIACGKSLAGEILIKHGISVLDSDKVVHQLYQEPSIQTKLIKEFGTIDRKQIAKAVFAQGAEAKRKALEAILHPEVARIFETWVKAESLRAERGEIKPILVNLVPLLYEAKLEKRYNKIAVIVTEPSVQASRLRARNPDMSEDEISQRISSQMPQEEKAKKADYIIKNNGSKADLEKQIEALLQGFLKST